MKLVEFPEQSVVLTFTRIPHEPRFMVASGTNPDQSYIVDLEWQEERWHRPRLKCGCVKGLQDLPCVHVRLIRELLNRLDR